MSAETRAVQLFEKLEKERATTRALKVEVETQRILVRQSWADGFMTGLAVVLVPILGGAILLAWLV